MVEEEEECLYFDADSFNRDGVIHQKGKIKKKTRHTMLVYRE